MNIWKKGQRTSLQALCLDHCDIIFRLTPARAASQPSEAKTGMQLSCSFSLQCLNLRHHSFAVLNRVAGTPKFGMLV